MVSPIRCILSVHYSCALLAPVSLTEHPFTASFYCCKKTEIVHRSLACLSSWFSVTLAASDWHLRWVLRVLFWHTSPALQGKATIKTTPPTSDLPKLQLRRVERVNMRRGGQWLSWEESNRDEGEEGRKTREEEEVVFLPFRREKHGGLKVRKSDRWVREWIRKDQYDSLIGQERKKKCKVTRKEREESTKTVTNCQTSWAQGKAGAVWKLPQTEFYQAEGRRLPPGHFRPQVGAGQWDPSGSEGCVCMCVRVSVSVASCVPVCRCDVCGCGRKSQAMSIILKPRSRSTSSLKNSEGIW